MSQISEANEVAVPTLQEPAGGVPGVCATRADLEELAIAFSAGTGPVALDAERASGHRYGQRAFLIQAKRTGAGIALIDPEALGDLSVFAEAIADAEWILHSATQDLACLADVGMRPAKLFDTELAARILNLPRVGLAALTESLMGWHLAKGHSAADWSIRPLPHEYLRYAALDVELLIELRDELADRLEATGKWPWAQQEFDALLSWTPTVHADPWRRTSGSADLRSPRALAILRSLWVTRDALGRELDLAPGRVLPDSSLVAAARQPPPSRAALLALPGFKRQQRRGSLWWQAIVLAQQLPDSGLPPVRTSSDGPPPPRSWGSRDPQAAERFASARAAVLAAAAEHDLPAEVLISPDLVRRLAWEPPDAPGQEAVALFLTSRAARPWQVELVAPVLAQALVSPQATGE